METKKNLTMQFEGKAGPAFINEEQLSTLLSTALSDADAFDFFDSEDPVDYFEVKHELQCELEEGNKDEIICREDVWARMLMEERICLIRESEWDYGEEPWHRLDIYDILMGLNLYFESSDCPYETLDDLLEEGDFDDAEAVLQYAVFGEIIYS